MMLFDDIIMTWYHYFDNISCAFVSVNCINFDLFMNCEWLFDSVEIIAIFSTLTRNMIIALEYKAFIRDSIIMITHYN